MITEQSVLAAWPLAEELANKGKCVRVREGTLLASLLGHIPFDFDKYEMPPGFGSKEEPADYKQYAPQFYATTIYDTTRGTPDVASNHDSAMDAVSKQIAEAVMRMVHFARNVVKPVADDFSTYLIAGIEGYKPKNGMDRFNIRMLDLPEPLMDGVIQDEIMEFGKGNGRVPNKLPAFKNKSIEEIINILMTGDKSLDQLIFRWKTKLGEAKLSSLWNGYFTTGGSSEDRYSGIYPSCYDEADAGLFIFLTARKLIEAVDKDIEGMSLFSYKTQLAQVRDYGAKLVSNAIRQHLGFKKQGVLVVYMDAKSYEIGVVGDIYREWTKGSGRPEILMGLLVSDKSFRQVDVINTNSDMLKDALNANCQLYNNGEELRYIQAVKDLIRIGYSRILKDFSEEEKPQLQRIQDFHGKAIARMDHIVDEITLRDLKETGSIEDIALRVVCIGRFFYFTGAYNIITRTKQNLNTTSSFQPKEAALLSTIEYICDYVADMLTIDTKL